MKVEKLPDKIRKKERGCSLETKKTNNYLRSSKMTRLKGELR